jgi:hypothetical protein
VKFKRRGGKVFRRYRKRNAEEGSGHSCEGADAQPRPEKRPAASADKLHCNILVQLPAKLLTCVCFYCSPITLTRIRVVSRGWRRVPTQNCLWSLLFRTRLGAAAATASESAVAAAAAAAAAAASSGVGAGAGGSAVASSLLPPPPLWVDRFRLHCASRARAIASRCAQRRQGLRTKQLAAKKEELLLAAHGQAKRGRLRETMRSVSTVTSAVASTAAPARGGHGCGHVQGGAQGGAGASGFNPLWNRQGGAAAAVKSTGQAVAEQVAGILALRAAITSSERERRHWQLEGERLAAELAAVEREEALERAQLAAVVK